MNNSVIETLAENKDKLAATIVEKHFLKHPGLEQRYGNIGRQKCLKDAHYHISYLSEAVRDVTPELFSDYIGWAKYMLEGRNIPGNDLYENLLVMKESITEIFQEEIAVLLNEYIDKGIQKLGELPDDIPSFIDTADNTGRLASEYLDLLLAGRRHDASKLILDKVNSGTGVKEIYLKVFQAVQYEIGRLWQLNRISVAQEHYSTAATQLIMSQLYPKIFSIDRNGYKLVATCIEEDLHEIGIRMIADFFEMEGWDTFYLGANTPVFSIISTLVERKADILAVSATMSYHVSSVSSLIAAVRANEKSKHVKIMVGGYPFNIAPELWRQLGADAHAFNAEDAIIKAGELTGADRQN